MLKKKILIFSFIFVILVTALVTYRLLKKECRWYEVEEWDNSTDPPTRIYNVVQECN